MTMSGMVIVTVFVYCINSRVYTKIHSFQNWVFLQTLDFQLYRYHRENRDSNTKIYDFCSE
jgi:hypothetical protein